MRTAPVDSIVSHYLKKYDHNGNGQIDLEKTGKADETTRRLDRSDAPTLRADGYSISRLAKEANTNRDNVLTADEIAAVVRKFDRNGDGKLEVAFLTPSEPDTEYGDFVWAVGERPMKNGKVNDMEKEDLKRSPADDLIHPDSDRTVGQDVSDFFKKLFR